MTCILFFFGGQDSTGTIFLAIYAQTVNLLKHTFNSQISDCAEIVIVLGYEKQELDKQHMLKVVSSIFDQNKVNIPWTFDDL